MKRLLLLSVVAAGLTAAASGCESAAAPTASPAVPPPDPFSFVLDHSPILIGSEAAHSFDIPVVNRTPEVVRFAGPIACGCACSETTLPRDTLGPGESMTLRLTVRTAGRLGVQRFTCHWGDDSNRPWSAGINVELLPPELFDQDRIALGFVTAGHTATETVTFKQHASRAEDLPPVRTFRAQEPGVSVTVGTAEVKSVRDGLVCRETPLTVTATVPDRVGYTGVRISPDAILNPYTPGNSLLVEWTVKPAVTVRPARVVFTDGGPIRYTLRLRADDGTPFRVTKAAATAGGVDVSVPLEMGKDGSQEVVVTLAEGRSEKTVTGDVRIETTHPRAASLSVPFVALVLPSGGEAPPAK